MASKQEDWLLNRLNMSFVSNSCPLPVEGSKIMLLSDTCLVSAFYFNSFFFHLFFWFFLVKKSNISLF